MEHEIILKSGKIVNIKSYRPPECHKNEISSQMDDLLKKEVIKHSKSPYNSPIWEVPEKAFDLSSGFHQIPMTGESKKYTAFSTPEGHFEFNIMPLGLKNAPATFQRMMDGALRGLVYNKTSLNSSKGFDRQG